MSRKARTCTLPCQHHNSGAAAFEAEILAPNCANVPTRAHTADVMSRLQVKRPYNDARWLCHSRNPARPAIKNPLQYHTAAWSDHAGLPANKPQFDGRGGLGTMGGGGNSGAN